MKIKSPTSSLTNLRAATERTNDLFSKLSTGARITKAADDATSLAISTRMESQLGALRGLRQNANEGDSLLQVADSGAEQAQGILSRMRELAVQASNSTRSDADRANAEVEFAELRKELDSVAETTEFNDRTLLDGAQSFAFQVGDGEGGSVEVNTDHGVSSANLGVDGSSVATAGDAQAALDAIDTASERVSETRSQLGAGSKRLRRASSAADSAIENTVAANSQIRDLDIAEAASAQMREAILQRSSIAILIQANSQPQAALNLIG